jgi:CMP-N-acetylneuraminic acid synthetase
LINGKSVLAIISARGGSKRLPQKNILLLAGKPLIVWTIEAGLNNRFIDRVVVSSDDEGILNISVDAGAEIIQRPQELATDEATSFSVIEHAYKVIDDEYDYTVLLQPTSPLRNSAHIDEAFDLLFEKQADAVVSVCETHHSPFWSNTLPENGSMKNFLKSGIKDKRSQDLPKYYKLNGAIYICKTEKLLGEESFLLKDNIFAYKMNRKNSIDVDDEVDLIVAETILQSENQN